MQRQKRILYQRSEFHQLSTNLLKLYKITNLRTYGDFWKNTDQRLKKIKLPDLETLPKTRPMEKKPIPRSQLS